jgi:hypothetical protein
LKPPFEPRHEADTQQAYPGAPQVPEWIPNYWYESTTFLDVHRRQVDQPIRIGNEEAAMLAFILTLGIALIWQLAAGTAFALLWNMAPAAVFGLPPMTWLQGVGVYLVIRLILSPPKLELTLGGNS